MSGVGPGLVYYLEDCFDTIFGTRLTNAPLGLHSIGERDEGSIPSPLTISGVGVTATREKHLGKYSSLIIMLQ